MALSPGGELTHHGVPVYTVICKACGFVRLFHADLLWMIRSATIVILAALAFPAAASASAGKEYVLPHPGRERCKAHYVKKVERVKVHRHHKTVEVKRTFCAYTPPPQDTMTPTATFVSASATTRSPGLEPAEQHVYFRVSGSILAGNMQVVGLRITYTITDATTGQMVGSFTGLSNAYASCTVVVRTNAQDTIRTYTGEAAGPAPYSACALAPTSMPAGDVAVFTGSFAGNSTYAPSVSKQETF